jgi:hypothetical protein
MDDRYYFIKYKHGNLGFMKSNNELLDYEFCDNIEHFRKKYNLSEVVNQFDFTLKDNGFELHFTSDFNIAIILLDKTKIDKESHYMRMIVKELFTLIMRDIKLKSILNV